MVLSCIYLTQNNTDMWYKFVIFANIHTININNMIANRETFKSDRDFTKCINDSLNGDIRCTNLIAPNAFPINTDYSIREIGKLNNRKVYDKKAISNRNFAIIENASWIILKPYRNVLLYEVFGFICNIIKYGSNVVRIQQDAIRSYVGTSVSNRDIQNVLEILENLNIIRKTNIRSIFTVNTFFIFKGNLDEFIERINNNYLDDYTITNNKLDIDKILMVEDKNSSGLIIKNKKFHTPYKEIEERTLSAEERYREGMDEIRTIIKDDRKIKREIKNVKIRLNMNNLK